MLGLIWRGGKITHQSGEHDDFATAAAGVIEQVLGRPPADPEFIKECLDIGAEEITPFAHAPLATVGPVERLVVEESRMRYPQHFCQCTHGQSSHIAKGNRPTEIAEEVWRAVWLSFRRGFVRKTRSRCARAESPRRSQA